MGTGAKIMSERWIPEEYAQGAGDVLGLYSSAFFGAVRGALGMLPEHSKAIDIGCAGGKWGAALALMKCNVTLMDIDEGMLVQTKKNYPYIKMNRICSSIKNIENIPKDFNLVVSDGLIEHYLDKETRINVIRNMYALLKAGFMVFTVPIMSGEEDEHQYVDKSEIYAEVQEALGNVPCTITDITFKDGRIWTVSLISKIL